ncbi:hypothetical protein BH09BAC3_BH09BAC3_07680 [soil metagenome]
MNKDEIEHMFLKSLDQPLTDSENDMLKQAIESDPELAKGLSGYNKIRESLLRKEEATFGPYFAQKVIVRIQGMREELEHDIIFFFKKFRLAALSLTIALIAVNIAFSDRLDIASVIGIEESAVVNEADDEIKTFDFLETLAND